MTLDLTVNTLHLGQFSNRIIENYLSRMKACLAKTSHLGVIFTGKVYSGTY